MTTYFITGATGFLGSRLVRRLLARPDCASVVVLVRAGSRHRVARAVADLAQPERVREVVGDLTEPGLGLDPAVTAELADQIDHVVHLGAVYDMTAGHAANHAANVLGTEHVIAFAGAVRAGKLHHVSSIAVAGDHRGRFTEDDFDLGQGFPTPYHATKFAAEKLVRGQDTVPWQIYRPAAVVGDSTTGEMDKVDGPYYFFPAVARLARLPLPSTVPLPVPHLGATNLVPVDYVVDAMDHLMHADGSARTFHLTSPHGQPLVTVYNALAKAAGAPQIPRTPGRVLRLPVTNPIGSAAAAFDAAARRLPAIGALRDAGLHQLGLPAEVLKVLTLPTEFDSTTTRQALDGSGLTVPEFADYARTLWRYWERNLDPFRARRRRPGGPLAGRRVVITGASSGIGRATAFAVAAKGGVPLLIARRAAELDAVRADIERSGGQAHTYPCDLTDEEAVSAVVKRMLTEHDGIDMLVNNAGRSIRRSLHDSLHRMHDFERTMAINYFGPVRLMLALLPHMTERRFGHIVQVSTMGTQVGTPRFSAYIASKSALESFTRIAGTETFADGVTFSTVHMPLVRTPMIAPTDLYRRVPAMTPEDAADLVVKALENRPKEVNLTIGKIAELSFALAPKAVTRLLNFGFLATATPSAQDPPAPETA